MMIDIPLIKNHDNKTISNKFFGMPSSKYFGLLQNKYGDVIIRIHILNKLISEIFLEHNLYTSAVALEDYSFEQVNQNFYSKFRYKTETLIYWFRKTSDELIGLQYFMFYIVENNAEPDVIKIESIGNLLNSDSYLKVVHDKSLIFLKLLNDVSNSYKHSFIDYEAAFLFGRYEPTLNSARRKWNKSENHAELFENNLRDIVTGFTQFYNDSMIFIDKQNDVFFKQATDKK